MPGVSTEIEQDIRQLVALSLQTVEILASQNAVDSANRQRVTIDSISGSLTLATVSAINTVTTVTTVSNITSLSGWDQRQFENPANLLFNQQITNNLSFS